MRVCDREHRDPDGQFRLTKERKRKSEREERRRKKKEKEKGERKRREKPRSMKMDWKKKYLLTRSMMSRRKENGNED